VSKPRWISEHLMRQMESEQNLALFGNDDARLILRILIACGLRLKDARQLPFDCVVRDNTGAPYLAWINHKIRQRVAFFPISEDLAARITAQQQQVLARFPGGCAWLFPALKVNLDGARPMPDVSLSVRGPPVNEDPLVVSSVSSSPWGAVDRSRSQGGAPAAKRGRMTLTLARTGASWRGPTSGG
jgi:hypothetical protein